MKKWIIPFLLTAALIGGLGWHNSTRLTEAREHQRRVAAEAARLGISPHSPPPAEVTRPTKIPRETAPPAGRLQAVFAITYMMETEAAQQNKGPRLQDDRERFIRIIDGIKAMNLAQLRGFVSEIVASEEISPDARKSLLNITMKTIVKDRPGDVLELFTSVTGLVDDEFESFVSQAIHYIAESDPAAALGWVRKNLKNRPELANHAAKVTAIYGVAPQDPKLAFGLIGEFEIETPADVTQGIMHTAKTPEARNQAIAALREYLPTIQDKDLRRDAGEYALAALGRSIVKEGFASSSEWVEKAGLTPGELRFLGSEMDSYVIDGEYGKWIGWFGRMYPANTSGNPMYPIMQAWAGKDYKAAGDWLNEAPAGAAKNKAISAYAQAVARYEPEAAARWAITLQPGDERNRTLNGVYCNWPKDSPEAAAAAEAFAKEHEIK